MGKKPGTVAMVMITLVIAACGGGGADDKGSGNVMGDGTIGKVDFCAGNSSSDVAMVGNNTFFYRPSSGQCFGAKTYANNVRKKATPVEYEFPGEPEFNAATVARLVSVITGAGTIAADTWFYFALDITNVSSVPVCDVRISGAGKAVDSSGNTLIDLGSTYLRADLYGDDSCIPPGETRVYYDSFVDTSGSLDAEDIDHLVLGKVEGSPLSAASVPQEALSSTGFEWNAVPYDSSGYRFNLTANMQFMNNRPAPITLENDFFEMVFLDDEDYPLFILLVDKSPDTGLVVDSGDGFSARYEWEGLDTRYLYTIFGPVTRVRVQLGAWSGG